MIATAAKRSTSRLDAIRASVSREDWNYGSANTQELTHDIHRYSGKFIPQIAARAIETLTESNEIVLDPYCGSGTTLLEAARLGRRAVGIDLSPLAVLIANCKVTPVDQGVTSKIFRSFTGLVAALEEPERGLFSPEPRDAEIINAAAQHWRLSDAWFTKWYQPQVLKDLIAIDLAIDTIPAEPVRNLARVAFSDVLRRSSNAHSGYPNVMFDKRAPPRNRPGKFFLKSLSDTMKKVQSLADASPVNWSLVRAETGDARALAFEDNHFDAVITHPPYIGSIPYAEYGALSLKWLGFDPKELDRKLTGGKRQSSDVVVRFTEAYEAALKEMWRVLKPRRHLFIMVGNPVVKGELIDLRAMTIALATDIGFNLIAKTSRTGANRRANKMGDEALLFFEKSSPEI